MRGPSVFVLICLSFVGELVLGSIFPTTPNGPQQPPWDFVDTQQEVKWPLENESTAAEVIVPAEAKIYSGGLRVEQIKDDNSESDPKPTEISPTIVVTNPDPESQIKTQNNAESKTEKLPLTNN